MIDTLFVVAILQIVTATSFGVLATTLIILGGVVINERRASWNARNFIYEN